MRFPTLVAASLIALTALPAAAQAQAQADYSARGTEPFWSLTIGARTMQFETPGRRAVVVQTPKVIHGFAGEIWQTRRIDVNTVHRSCSDGMSDRVYSDTVTVKVDGRTYKGCGGDASTPAGRGRLIEGSWRIEALSGRPVARGTTPDVTFRDGHISGNASCNRFNGSYDFARGRLTAGPLATTRMACMERVKNVQEATILRLFGEKLSVSRNRAGKLVLSSADGRTMTLAPERGR
ncbi:heat shock protein HslJ [Sphingomonas naasensis]|uniref:META domain-containing protein n=1 Tax=Sphingomonas naasensis TaxID=1344951 RepID=A0A4S1WSE3_9SPHN|nr:META domain-containing protein [Sphingomonas naasensis]NIJ20155.1 heat shock protein HslJ [Sphingomonas naasensis]TGX44306.1 META domain-containing protein [Sphingomonas naasensis]